MGILFWINSIILILFPRPLQTKMNLLLRALVNKQRIWISRSKLFSLTIQCQHLPVLKWIVQTDFNFGKCPMAMENNYLVIIILPVNCGFKLIDRSTPAYASFIFNHNPTCCAYIPCYVSSQHSTLYHWQNDTYLCIPLGKIVIFSW